MSAIRLLTTRSAHEVDVARRSRELGVRAYVPRLLEFTRGGNEEVVLFPGYVFVWIIQDSAWRLLRNIRHARDFVRVAGVPAVVPEKVVTELRVNENEYGFIVNKPKFLAGDRVRIGDGLARVIGYDPNRFVRILLSMLGKSVELVMPERDLVAA